MKYGYVYIIGNNRLTLYTGVTSNLVRRIYEHKNKVRNGFSKRYNLNILLYYEVHDTIMQGIIREKQIKDMNRKEKIKIIKTMNPDFIDLYPKVIESLWS